MNGCVNQLIILRPQRTHDVVDSGAHGVSNIEELVTATALQHCVYERRHVVEATLVKTVKKSGNTFRNFKETQLYSVFEKSRKTPDNFLTVSVT